MISCCNKPKLKQYNNKIFCHNCYKDFVKPVSRNVDNTRLKYLRKNFNQLDNNIMIYLDRALKEIQTYKNLKRNISIPVYVNSIYNYYCKKYNIEYKPLNNKKLINFDDNIINILNEISDEYPYFNIENDFERMYI